MTLEDGAARVGLSLVRIKQIEHAALVKLSKRVDPDMYYE
jgi:DNA-directed RNA polymerase sigma subunit (sigma70/sigma32)